MYPFCVAWVQSDVDRQMKGWMFEWTDMYIQVDEWIDKWTDGCRSQWSGMWMYGQSVGQTAVCVCVCFDVGMGRHVCAYR
jgi:hypothetical protein